MSHVLANTRMLSKLEFLTVVLSAYFETGFIIKVRIWVEDGCVWEIRWLLASLTANLIEELGSMQSLQASCQHTELHKSGIGHILIRLLLRPLLENTARLAMFQSMIFHQWGTRDQQCHWHIDAVYILASEKAQSSRALEEYTFSLGSQAHTPD